MAASLSSDLRERIVQAYLRGEGTRAEIAARFDVGPASVDRYVRLYRQSGSVAAKPHAGGPRPRVPDEDRALLEAYLQENPSLTQAELAERYSKETGRHISQRTMSRVLRRFGITRKKKRRMPPSETEKTSR